MGRVRAVNSPLKILQAFIKAFHLAEGIDKAEKAPNQSIVRWQDQLAVSACATPS
jgi:hypothetical protein